MAYGFQIAVDATEPHTLADWWAETLGWRVEPQDEGFIKEMIAKGFATEAETIRHNGALVWKAGAAIRHPDDLPGAPRVLFQQVPEAKTVKNRMHLDVRVGDEDQGAVRDRLIARGATFLWDGRQGPHTWLTMADPENNEFCIS
ncbi:VOC family protein [Actinoplanes aureus]|uniref:VOC family protein n=1 Tax=Actinoplanes aureus TaxID=2792083 RepID=A0A931FV27_9ACTN|nr:VOC family protein [Actinoplanes aureus]MBG0560878.1 VOC family protein [Actinoplanes aureus]